MGQNAFGGGSRGEWEGGRESGKEGGRVGGRAESGRDRRMGKEGEWKESRGWREKDFGRDVKCSKSVPVFLSPSLSVSTIHTVGSQYILCVQLHKPKTNRQLNGNYCTIIYPLLSTPILLAHSSSLPPLPSPRCQPEVHCSLCLQTALALRKVHCHRTSSATHPSCSSC